MLGKRLQMNVSEWMSVKDMQFQLNMENTGGSSTVLLVTVLQYCRSSVDKFWRLIYLLLPLYTE